LHQSDDDLFCVLAALLLVLCDQFSSGFLAVADVANAEVIASDDGKFTVVESLINRF
jgi:hypothetical protein